MIQLGLQVLPAQLQLLVGHDLEHVALASHQDADLLERVSAARAQRCDRVVVAGVALRRGLSRPDEGVVLRRQLVDVRVQLAQVLVRVRQSLVVVQLQTPGQHALQAADAKRLRRSLGVARAAQADLERFDLRRRSLFVRGREIVRPRRDQHVLEALLDAVALLDAQADLRVERAELTIDLRQQRLVVRAPHAHDVLEGVEARAPRDHLLPHVLEIQIVRKPRLELVRRHQRHQVEGLGRVGQIAQANHPVLVLTDLLANQSFEERAAGDARERSVDLPELFTEGLDGPSVEEGRSTLHAQLAVREWQGEDGFLHRGVRGFALGEDAPRNQRPVELLRRSVGPARAKQRLVGERTLQTNPIQRALGRLERRRFEEQRAEHEVRLVDDRERGRVAALHLTCAVELLDGFLLPAVLQQRDAEVVGREALQVFRVLQALQHVDGVGGAIERQVDVRAQELDVVSDVLRHLSTDLLENLQGFLGLALLEVDSRQAKRRFVAHLLVDVGLEHGLDGPARAMVHAVAQLEVTDVEVRALDERVQGVELGLVDAVVLGDLRVETLQRFEPVLLVRVVQRLSEVEVFGTVAGGGPDGQ